MEPSSCCRSSFPNLSVAVQNPHVLHSSRDYYNHIISNANNASCHTYTHNNGLHSCSGINIALTVDYANVQVNHYDMSRNTQLVCF